MATEPLPTIYWRCPECEEFVSNNDPRVFTSEGWMHLSCRYPDSVIPAPPKRPSLWRRLTGRTA